MGKMTERFNALTARRRFILVFSICLAICLPVIPITIHSDRRILEQLSDFQFGLFALVLCVGYAALLAGMGMICEKTHTWMSRKKASNHTSDGIRQPADGAPKPSR